MLKETAAARVKDNAPPALATAELLSLVTGVNATKSLALLRKFDGSLRSMRCEFTPVTAAGGRELTQSQAVRLVAALELGRRMEAEGRPTDGVPIRSPRDVVEHCGSSLEDLPVEEFHIMVLDSQHRLVKKVLITRGLLNSSLVHPREVFREAIRYRAAAIILVHNHPSGDPTPSSDDRVVTEQLVQAGRLLDIPVQDHIVIGHAGSYASFAEAGLL
jgi:DNA repair protein RadC